MATLERLERALMPFLVVAWRSARPMRLGGTPPDLDAGLLLEPEQWQAAYRLTNRPLPAKTPRLNEVLRLIAPLGGFLARRTAGEPGVKTIWLGLQCTLDLAAGVKHAKDAYGT